MTEYPRLTAKEAEKLLLRNGFVLDRQKGSHRIDMKKMVVPHPKKDLPPGTVRSIRKQAGI